MATISQQAYGDLIAAVKTNRVKQVTIGSSRIEYTVVSENGEEDYYTIPVGGASPVENRPRVRPWAARPGDSVPSRASSAESDLRCRVG